MRTFCAGALEPKSEWERGRCRGWNDDSLLARFYRPVPLTGAKAARQARRMGAAQMNTVSHHNGLVFVPARRGRAPK